MPDANLRIAVLYPELPAARELQFQLRSSHRFQVVCVTHVRQRLLEALVPLEVDAVVVSSALEGGDAIPVTQEIEIYAPQVGTLVRAASGGGVTAACRLLHRGAAGCILEDDEPEVLHEATRLVAEGGTYISSRAAFRLLGVRRAVGPPDRLPGGRPALSKREKEVMRAILEERTTAEIAEALSISFGTVETHRRNMLAKVGARNTAGLVRYCFEFALLD